MWSYVLNWNYNNFLFPTTTKKKNPFYSEVTAIALPFISLSHKEIT